MDERATPRNRTPKRVVERNMELLCHLMQYLLAQPKVVASLPSDFELVILPDDDLEIKLYNLKLLETLSRQDKPIVFARVKSSRKANWRKQQPSLYMPLEV